MSLGSIQYLLKLGVGRNFGLADDFWSILTLCQISIKSGHRRNFYFAKTKLNIVWNMYLNCISISSTVSSLFQIRTNVLLD